MLTWKELSSQVYENKTTFKLSTFIGLFNRDYTRTIHTQVLKDFKEMPGTMLF